MRQCQDVNENDNVVLEDQQELRSNTGLVGGRRVE